jgi:mRNA-degrading endonuclease toxin of MazEF toxin-antitoxin module
VPIGDIVTLPFPFNERAMQTFKRRPVLILGETSPDAAGDEAILVAMVTGNPDRYRNPDDGDIRIHLWQSIGLQNESVVRCRRLWTAERRDIVRRVGPLDGRTLRDVISEVARLFPRVVPEVQPIHEPRESGSV